LIDQATEGNDYQKILLISGPVKGKIVFGNSLGFQAQIEDLHLNYCIPRKNPKNNISGSTLCFSGKNSPSCRI